LNHPYWVDASALIQARRHLYPNSGHVFWGFLSDKIAQGTICSPNAVYQEIVNFLKTFVMTRRTQGMSVPLPREAQMIMRKIVGYCRANYSRTWFDEFIVGGDPAVVACVIHFGGTLVTEE
jgi:hypothetical protein